MLEKIVSFDFDGTLSKPHVQEYAKELIARGLDVWVITARYDELHSHLYNFNDATNDDLWKIIDDLGIPKWKVCFMNMNPKADYITNTKIIWHLDDDFVELSNIRHAHIPTIGIQVNAGSWKRKCERLLKDKSYEEKNNPSISTQGEEV